MLILTRRVGESLVIGDEVGVKVLGVKGGQVRLGVEAPRDIAIHREEIIQRQMQPNSGEEARTGPKAVVFPASVDADKLGT